MRCVALGQGIATCGVQYCVQHTLRGVQYGYGYGHMRCAVLGQCIALCGVRMRCAVLRPGGAQERSSGGSSDDGLTGVTPSRYSKSGSLPPPPPRFSLSPSLSL
eukprot:3149170-Rhodomonas_salina.1